jgi:TolA-binding protein
VRVGEGRVRVEGLEGSETDDAAFTVRAGEARELCRPEPVAEPVDAARPVSEARLMRAALDDMAAGDLDTAVRQFETYLFFFPEGGFVEDAMFHRAVLLLRRGDRAKAQAAIEAFAARYPDSTRRKTLEGLLQK